jgi:hypothetical protein
VRPTVPASVEKIALTLDVVSNTRYDLLMDSANKKARLLAAAKAVSNPVLKLRALKIRGLAANDNGRAVKKAVGK